MQMILPKIEISQPEQPLTLAAKEAAWHRVWMEKQALKLAAARLARQQGAGAGNRNLALAA